ncbi:histidine kinase dimerization/phosphoacceptor domain -containing protein [Maridesulfovibrio hydrothermalis]|uniref:Signal transduction histidine kinase n=1 Tax=Maridesulfovibrio hydrothermalis AM13 = DSM 14728 TaxID=1121451 RepID=L0RDQ6_9BACT|nr:histidine kinase dimerization/phosphoacceptor domain -containing protein [Maridesulfovibrio hydrothermalis]CCO24330.1 Signal transduction histidine kinase [Maridesulfovibrio hydrothermalis AM13 = DSM 14728]
MDDSPKVLTIDDDESVRLSIAHFLEDSGYEVLQAGNGSEGLDIFREHKPDVVLLDLRMPEMDGLSVLKTLGQEAPQTPVIVVSGTGSFDDVIATVRLGSWDYIPKPITDLNDLECAIIRTRERARLLVENERYKEELEIKIRQRTEELQQMNKVLSEEISARKTSEKMVRASLAEKEVMLKEIHHRVKNNLQVISSLLSLQSGYTDDIEASNLLRECQHRVRSMSMLHEKLYRSEDLSRIDMNEYALTLINFLLRSYSVDGKVTPTFDINNVHLGIDSAIPCGLIINELVSNALRHAYPEEGVGTLSISMNRTDGYIKLVVSDNGIGMPEEFTIGSTKTLGMTLVETLAQQLSGKVDFCNNNGATIQITFPG